MPNGTFSHHATQSFYHCFVTYHLELSSFIYQLYIPVGPNSIEIINKLEEKETEDKLKTKNKKKGMQG